MEIKTQQLIMQNVCDIEGVKKYYVHYKGWNSRHDEWIDAMRIAYKTKDPEPGLEVDNADSSKSSPPEQKNVDLKKVPLRSSKTRSSVTPLTPKSNVKKSPFSSARPTRTCTLTDRTLYNIDNSDLEGKYTVSEGSYKQYSIKKVIKSEPDVIIKTEPLDTDDHEKTEYPIIYPMKKLLLRRVISSQLNEVDICKQVILEQPFEPPSYSIKPNADNENIEAQNENKIEGIQIELKIAPNHCLSPKVKSKNNDPEYFNIINEIENPIMINQSNNDSNEFQNSISEGGMVNTPNINEIEQRFQYVSDSKYEVLDLSMKPPESPPTNIFSMPEHYESNDMIVEEGDDDEDYDESKLVNAENYKIEIDNHKDSDLVVISKKHNSSNVQIDKNIESQSLPLLRPYKHTNIEIDYKRSSHVKRDISIPKDTDDQSTAYCNKSFQYSLVQRNHSSQNRLYMDNNYENTKSCFEFYPNSKPPSIEVREVIAEPSINDKPKTCDFVVKNVKDKYNKEKTMVLPELKCRKEIEDKDTLKNLLNIEYNCKSAEHGIYKPSTSKGFFDSIYQPGTSKNSFYVADTRSDAKNSFFEASQAVKNVIFDTNVHGKSSLFDPNIPSCSTKDFYDHNISSTSKSNFYENSLPSTSKSVYNSEYDVNSFLICEETIPGSPTGKSEEQYEQRRKKAQTLYEEREAASAMYAMNQPLCRPMMTLMGATEEEMEEYTNILKKDGAILDQQHLLFLSEISSKKLGMNINEPSVTERLEREPETIVQKIAKPQEKLQFKRKISSHEQTSKRSKLSNTTAPIPSVSRVKEPDEEEKKWKSLLFIPVFSPEMKTAQRQAVLSDMMNNLQKEYAILKARLVVVGRRKKKINKRKREQAKAARQAASSESQ
ncbi:unnamed protein product [Macrosiphum euphorbiae]|uniref:Tudor-knot domain-containing protein n=1 Tax=Macrosiphum euphorbiae TaxID=13131 RepID=A0AAV0XYQ9_9HEMI|nr:unnamed protein product [Macrosiphum euphorbiae]